MKTNKKLQLAFLMVTVLLMSSCATSYRAIKPELFKYPSSVTEDGIQIAYKYDVMKSVGNNRYSAKESNQGLRLIAIQIKNQSDTTIRLSRDCDLFVGDLKVIPVDSKTLAQRLKQKVWPYYFYLLMTFVQLNYVITTPSSITMGTLPIGYVLGPGLTTLNVTKAAHSNRMLYYNLKDGEVWDRDIQSGETVYGLIGLESREVVPIHIRRRK